MLIRIITPLSINVVFQDMLLIINCIHDELAAIFGRIVYNYVHEAVRAVENGFLTINEVLKIRPF